MIVLLYILRIVLYGAQRCLISGRYFSFFFLWSEFPLPLQRVRVLYVRSCCCCCCCNLTTYHSYVHGCCCTPHHSHYNRPRYTRPTPSPELGNDAAAAAAAVPDITLRASAWVDRCLWAAAAEVGGEGGNNGAGGIGGIGAGGNGVVGLGAGVGAGAGISAAGGPDAHPELVEALFKLMAEWVKELPVPSLRCELN